MKHTYASTYHFWCPKYVIQAVNSYISATNLLMLASMLCSCNEENFFSAFK
jgi:hypothetical protein